MASRAHPRLHHFSTHQLQLSHKNFFGPALSISHTHITSTHTRATQSWITRASLNFFWWAIQLASHSNCVQPHTHRIDHVIKLFSFFLITCHTSIDASITHTHLTASEKFFGPHRIVTASHKSATASSPSDLEVTATSQLSVQKNSSEKSSLRIFKTRVCDPHCVASLATIFLTGWLAQDPASQGLRLRRSPITSRIHFVSTRRVPPKMFDSRNLTSPGFQTPESLINTVRFTHRIPGFGGPENGPLFRGPQKNTNFFGPWHEPCS